MSDQVVYKILQITNLKSVRLSSLQVSQLNIDQNELIAVEAKGLSGEFETTKVRLIGRLVFQTIIAIEKFQKLSDGVHCIAAEDGSQAEL